MRLHFLVEGPAEVQLLKGLLPRLIPQHTFQIYPHQGKGKLRDNPSLRPDPKHRGVLDQLPATLRAWGKSLSPQTDRVVVLVDSDNDDLKWLIEKLSEMLTTISPAPACLFRVAVEEVEAWYLGDWPALKRAFPKARKTQWRKYRQDTVCGTWEIFQQIIQDSLERKPYWGQKIGVELGVDEESNASMSFKKFCSGVRRHAGEGMTTPSIAPKRASQRTRTAAKKSSPKK